MKLLITKLINNFLFPPYKGIKKEKIDTKKKICVYYATKPLQYINLRNTGMSGNNYNILILCGYFQSADNFFQRIKEFDSDIWDEMLFFDKQRTAFRKILSYCKVDFLFINWDLGIDYNMFFAELDARNCRIYLYEEGIGNYVWNENASFPTIKIIKKIPPIIMKVYRLIKRKIYGVQRLGENKILHGIYLYFPEYPMLRCDRSKVLPFKNTFMQQIESYLHFYSSNPFIKALSCYQNINILFIALGWSTEYCISEEDKKKYDLIIVKFHPHINVQLSELPQIEKLLFINGNLMTEIIITLLMKNRNNITLRSKDSSSIFYLYNTGINIEVIGGVQEVLHPLWNYVRNLNKKID